jgi:hypothetical protein
VRATPGVARDQQGRQGAKEWASDEVA